MSKMKAKLIRMDEETERQLKELAIAVGVSETEVVRSLLHQSYDNMLGSPKFNQMVMLMREFNTKIKELVGMRPDEVVTDSEQLALRLLGLDEPNKPDDR